MGPDAEAVTSRWLLHCSLPQVLQTLLMMACSLLREHCVISSVRLLLMPSPQGLIVGMLGPLGRLSLLVIVHSYRAPCLHGMPSWAE